MRLLIDTQIILWLLADDARLSTGAKEKLKTQENEVFYSVASLWEIGIKRNLGRLPVTPLEVAKAMDESGFTRLAIEDEHLERITNLPLHHRDPFDRMLIAQAEAEPLRLLTSDRRLIAYGPFVFPI